MGVDLEKKGGARKGYVAFDEVLRFDYIKCIFMIYF